ncbi:MAG: cytochrome C biosynthesis protein [Pseudomonadota bacterium]
MGWLLLALMGGAALAALWLSRAARGLWMFVAAALMLGAAGYAWQQRAALPGHPVTAESRAIDVQEGFVAFRAAIMPGRPGDDRILAAADEQLRAGDTTAAGRVMLDAIAADPNDAALWTGLGTVLVAHDEGQLSPAAQFAFRRAQSLAPREPGPLFFLGLAYAQGNDLPAAKPVWERALALTPADAPYRSVIADQLTGIDEAMRAETAAPSSPGVGKQP